MQSKTKILLLIIKLSFVFSFGINAQIETLEDLKTVLIYKLCEYVTWPSDTVGTYTLGVLTENPLMEESLRKYAPSFNINGQPIAVEKMEEIHEVSKFELLFIDENNGSNLTQINDLVNNMGILLFSENHEISGEFMFNLLTNQKRGMVSFEFNRANLIFEGFDVHPDIIELRGSEIDIRDLYRQTKSKLEIEENKVEQLSGRLKQQEEDLLNQEKIIRSQNKEIDNKNDSIKNQSSTIKQNEQELSNINQQLIKLQDEVGRRQDRLIELQNQIRTVNFSLNNQKKLQEKQIFILDSLNKSIDAKQKIIDDKDRVLVQKESQISYRNMAIVAFSVISIITLILLFLVYRTNKANKSAKVVLANQKEELQSTLEKLTQAQNQLIQSEKMASLGTLVAGIAHEINNPVNFISTSISALKKSFKNMITVLDKYRSKYANNSDNQEIKNIEEKLQLDYLLNANDKMFSNIKSGIDRTVNIIKSLQVFSHGNETRSMIDIHENIDLALTILYNQYKYGIEIIKDYGKIPEIDCFPGKMNQVFVNLINNSIQAIDDKGKIEIKTWSANGSVFIKIKDDGCGIPDEIKNKVFDPFFTTKEVGAGTGMGLSLVYNIVQSHNGEIVLDSELGKYTEFIIKLPV